MAGRKILRYEEAEPFKTERRFLAHSWWDAVPITMGLGHLLAVIALVASFRALPWWIFLSLALLYSISLSWSINSIAHNFIHNPYFVSPVLNRAFSLLLSVTIGFSQVMYHYIHMRHHAGNMDRQDANGDTVDHISIYRHGRDGKPENPWRYVFSSYFRDDPMEILTKIAAKQPKEARFAKVEVAADLLFYGILLFVDWRAVLCLVPFYYLGQSLSSLNGYYEHFGADPDRPISWGVSSYGTLYNWTWMNNGYHAEHHYRPKIHWTKMPELHRTIATEQKAAAVRVISWPHALGFLAARPLDRRTNPS
jgi:fatty acid desaturase